MNTTNNQPITHDDYADEAESASRANAWPQAAALYRRAADTCPDETQAAAYTRQAHACDHEATAEATLAGIARRVLGIPTLDSGFCHLKEVVLKEALWQAYHAGRNAPRT